MRAPDTLRVRHQPLQARDRRLFRQPPTSCRPSSAAAGKDALARSSCSDILAAATRAARTLTQPEALGTGPCRPVREAGSIGDEPFGVILPDDLIWTGNGPGALRRIEQSWPRAENCWRDGRRGRCRATRLAQIRHRRCDHQLSERAAIDPACCGRKAQARTLAPSNLAIVGRPRAAGPHLRAARNAPSRAPVARSS